jgi:hypothetical protein
VPPRFRWLTALSAMPSHCGPLSDGPAYHIGRTVVQHSKSAQASVQKGHSAAWQRVRATSALPPQSRHALTR